MRNVVSIFGTQFGDEGKGKVVEYYSKKVDMVVRFAGGANAGHTLVVPIYGKIITHLLPSGITRPNVICVLADGMVIDPEGLYQEIKNAKNVGLLENFKKLQISFRAHIVMPYHKLLDKLREEASKNRIGTTRKGIGPAYEAKTGRYGIRMEDILEHSNILREKIKLALSRVNPEIDHLGSSIISEKDMMDFLITARERLSHYITNTADLINKACKNGKKVLFEGAQGGALDIDEGTYPWCTSSNVFDIGSGAGIDPRLITKQIGVAKAYLTRVGGGPFATKMDNTLGKIIQKQGNEFGATTGRPRDCGWVDVVALRAMVRKGVDCLAITKLDVLQGVNPVKICYKYALNGVAINHYADISPRSFYNVKPVYLELDGFDNDISGVTCYDELPKNAKNIVETICALSNTKLALVSIGPKRNETLEILKIF